MQFALLLCNVYAVDLDYLVFQFINCLVRCSIMARGGGRGGASQQRNTHHHQQQHSRAAVAQQVTAKKQLPGVFSDLNFIFIFKFKLCFKFKVVIRARVRRAFMI